MCVIAVMRRPPGLSGLLRLLDRSKDIRIEQLFADARIERLDVGILGRRSRLDEDRLYAVVFSPVGDGARAQFRSVIHAQAAWIPVALRQPLEDRDDARAEKRKTHLDREPITTELVEHGERSKCTTV